MDTDNIINNLFGNRKDYKGCSLFYEKLKTDAEFKKIILEGISEGKITAFNDDIWDLIGKIRTRIYKSLLDVFKDGKNIGCCNQLSIELSYGFRDFYLVDGVFDYIKNTVAAPNGEHCWLEDDNYIYDTTFMLIIDKEYKNKLKYHEKRRISSYNLRNNRMYDTAKEFAFPSGKYEYYQSKMTR